MELCLKDKVIYVFGTGARKITQIPKAIREFTRDGARVYTMISDMGRELVDSSLSDFNIKGNINVMGYSKKGEELPLEDLVLVAPCTFNTLNKLANGITDTYPLTITATAIGAHRKVILAPAMNKFLWYHPITVESIRKLERWGCKVILPDTTPENVTMTPIEKIADTVYYELIKIRFSSRQLPVDESFNKLVSKQYVHFLRAGKSLSDSDLTRGSAGCLSTRVNEGILVTSSGSQTGSLSEDELSLVKKVDKETIIWQGKRLPSSESPVLTELYKRFPKAEAIVHSHCPRITYDSKMQKYCTQEYIRYGIFGEGDKVAEVMERNEGFAILRYHGEIVFGKSLDDGVSKLKRRLEEAHEK